MRRIKLLGNPSPRIPRQSHVYYVPEPDEPSAVVYYIGDCAAQQVKIGTTIQIGARIRSIARKRIGPLLLLATEPGSYTLETRRHFQFRDLRLRPRGEWFRKDPQLMEHVGRIRIAYGILPSGDGGPPPEWIAPLRR